MKYIARVRPWQEATLWAKFPTPPVDVCGQTTVLVTEWWQRRWQQPFITSFSHASLDRLVSTRCNFILSWSAKTLYLIHLRCIEETAASRLESNCPATSPRAAKQSKLLQTVYDTSPQQSDQTSKNTTFEANSRVGNAVKIIVGNGSHGHGLQYIDSWCGCGSGNKTLEQKTFLNTMLQGSTNGWIKTKLEQRRILNDTMVMWIGRPRRSLQRQRRVEAPLNKLRFTWVTCWNTAEAVARQSSH